jgi:uncharacterized repeat protein (TIGR01451 family)
MMTARQLGGCRRVRVGTLAQLAVICYLALLQTIQAQGTAVKTLVFDSDRSGRSQIYTQDLDANGLPLGQPNQVTSVGGGQQQAQEPQWSLAASSGIDTIGRIAYQFGASGVRGIHIIKPDGSGEHKLTPSSPGYACTDARDPSWSPDGRYIAYACLVAPLNSYDIWIHDTGVATPDDPSDDFDYPLITLSSSQELRPAWSPDGTMIAFVTSAPGTIGTGSTSKIAIVQVTIVDGNVQPFAGTNDVGSFVLLTDDNFTNFSPTWSPDSQQIAFSTTRSGGRDIYRMSARFGEGDSSTFVRLTASPANDSNPAWAPDGRTIAFASNRSGTNQIYSMSAVAGDAVADLVLISACTNPTPGSVGPLCANDSNPGWNPQSTASPTSLTLIVPDVSVVSGVDMPTGSGTVTVTDGFGHVVPGAVITIVPPSTGTGTLGFGLPSPSITDENGQLTFTVEEPTSQSMADYQFAVAASDPSTGKTGAVAAMIRVFGSGSIVPPQPPGPIPVPPEVRLPLGGNTYTAQQKAHFQELAAELYQDAQKHYLAHVVIDLSFSSVEFSVGQAGITTIVKAFHNYLGPAHIAYTLLSYFEIYALVTYGNYFTALAQDPPDQNFTVVAVPEIQSPRSIAVVGGPFSAQTASLINTTVFGKVLTSAHLKALSTSINRYTTALGAGDLTSAALQRNAILAHQDSLAVLFQIDTQNSQALAASLQQDGFTDLQLSTANIQAVQSFLAKNGTPSQTFQMLSQLGLTPDDINAMQDRLLAAPAASFTGGVIEALQTEASASQTASVRFARLSPPVPPVIPKVLVSGGTFVYDGTAHRANATATGVSGAPVSGSFSITYTPSGFSVPVNVGTYSVTAQFTSNDPNYTSASGTGMITIVPASQTETTAPTGSMHFARVSHQAILLNTGFVLVSGGQSGGAAVPQTELFNPVTGTWSLTGSSVIPRFDHSATLLIDGRVLVAGGVSANGDCSSNATAEIYDPATGSWSLKGRLPSPAGTGHIAIRLLDGRVLVAGGGNRCGVVFSTAAVFDPSANKWSATGSMAVPRAFHSAALLSDGRVLVAGGVTGSPLASVSSAEMYNPVTGTWTAVGGMATPRQTSCDEFMQTYLATLGGGTVLAAGGFSGSNCSPLSPERTVVGAMVNPGSVQLSDLGQTRALAVAAQMSDGSTQPFTGPLQFSSDNTAIASVDSAGVVTSIGPGTATITVAGSGVAPVSLTTTVELRRLISMTASVQTATLLGSGQTQSLLINGQFSDGSQQTLTTGVTFSSSNPAVASVSQTGLVTSGANGIATISVSAQGVPVVQVPITVKSLVSIVPSPTSIAFNEIGRVQTLTISGQFSDGSQQSLTSGLSFISSNPSVARVDLSGVVTSVGNGTATITVSAPNVATIQVPVTVTLANVPALSITKSHSGSFTQGQQGATYTVRVSNAANAGATSGTVTVTDTLPAGLTLVSMVGAGWQCGTGSSCTRSDGLAAGSSYPPITVSVNVTATASSPQVNAVAVSGGGSAGANATDSTTITPAVPTLSITKTHSGAFAPGQQGASYTVMVSNAANAAPTIGTVIVAETPPAGLTLVSMAGTGWECASTSCTRSDVLAPGASYPSITVTVNVAANAASPQVNTVAVSGGGSASANATDSTIITSNPAPVITLLFPKSALSGRVIANLNVAGANLSGSTFSLAPAASPPIVVDAATINPAGTSAVMKVTIPITVIGTFALVATSSEGASDSTPTPQNRFVVVDPNSTADTDGDGFPDVVEAEFGSDPLDPASLPVIVPPEVSFSFSLLNRAVPTSTQPTPVEPTFSFSLLNRALPTSTQPTPVEPTFSFSLLNRALPASTQPTPVEPTFSFSLLNHALPTSTQPTTFEPTFSFSLLNRVNPASVQPVGLELGWLFSIQNLAVISPVQLSSEPSASSTAKLLGVRPDGGALPGMVRLVVGGKSFSARPEDDYDHDGLTNGEEDHRGTDLARVDSDGDGLSDGDEVLLYHTHPLNPDTDGDRFSDGDEVREGTDPLDAKSKPDLTVPGLIEIVSPEVKVKNANAPIGNSRREDELKK